MVALNFQINRIERYASGEAFMSQGSAFRPGSTLYKEFDGPNLPFDLVVPVAFCSSTGCMLKDVILKVEPDTQQTPSKS